MNFRLNSYLSHKNSLRVFLQLEAFEATLELFSSLQQAILLSGDY